LPAFTQATGDLIPLRPLTHFNKLYPEETQRNKSVKMGYYIVDGICRKVTVVPDQGDALALMFTRSERGAVRIRIINPSLLSPELLCNNILLTAQYIRRIADSDPVLLALADAGFSDAEIFEDKILIIITYLFLTPSPIPGFLSQQWLCDCGMEPDKAEDVARKIYLLRTERDGQEPGFYSGFDHLDACPSECMQTFRRPLSLQEVLDVKGAAWIAFDESEYLCEGFNSLPGTGFLADELTETTFIIEDHDQIVLGLGISLMEASVMLQAVPEFLRFITGNFPPEKMGMVSLGSLLRSCFQNDRLLPGTCGKATLALFAKDGTLTLQPLEKVAKGVFRYWSASEYIPAFIMISKH